MTAQVRLNTTQAEKSIDNLVKKINKINNAINSKNSNALDRNVKKANSSAKKLQQTTDKIASSTQKVNGATRILNSLYEKGRTLGTNIVDKTKKWYEAQHKVRNSIKGSNDLLKGVWNRLTAIASTYLGIMGAKTLINTSDTITSAAPIVCSPLTTHPMAVFSPMH